ncbi:hypothetical protein ACLPJK_26350 [Pseudomonas aeruginosa]|uniref:hypothetical protein n=1 Tax=Pseudomonas aeruginosa TaxID=287 RepID=UPI003D2BCCCD
MKNYSLIYKDLRESALLESEKMPAVEVCLAKALAYRLPIPAEQVDNLTDYYRTTHQGVVNKAISEVGEAIPINAVDAQKLTWALYNLRYQLVHCPPHSVLNAVVQSLASDTNFEPFKNTLPPRYTSTLSQPPRSGLQTLVDEAVSKALCVE